MIDCITNIESFPIIIFNDIALPRETIFIDMCASNRIIESISEDISVWFWRFTICVGITKTEQSSVVLMFATELKEIMESEKEIIKKNVSKIYGCKSTEQIIESWDKALTIMIETAKTREVCVWTAG